MRAAPDEVWCTFGGVSKPRTSPKSPTWGDSPVLASRTMRYVVGYGPRQRGIDGLNLAATLARSSGATLDVVSVLPSDAPTFHRYSPDHAFNAEVEEQGREWLEDGLARVPDGVVAEGHLRRADSITEGLLDSSIDPERGEAALIVVGTYHRVRSGRFALGSLADSLLHASAVPVALAPAEYQGHPGITRITCAVGMRPGTRSCSTTRSDWPATGTSRCG